MGFVVADLHWSKLQPTPNGPIDTTGTGPGTWSQLKTALRYGVDVRVRVHCGDEAPAWAKSLGGDPLTLVLTEESGDDGSETFTCGRWWTQEYLSGWGQLMEKLAPLLEGQERVKEIASHPATTVYAEPFQRGTRGVTSKATGMTNVEVIYRAMKQTDPDGAQVETSGGLVVGPAKLDAAAILWPTTRWESFGWETTRYYLPFNPFQQWRVITESPFTYTAIADPGGWTQTAIAQVVESMGDRVVIANNSLRVPLSVLGGKYTVMVAAFPDDALTGFQTATQERLTAAYRTVVPTATDTQALHATLDVGLGIVSTSPSTALHARSVELPPGWPGVLTDPARCATYNATAANNPSGDK